MKYTDLIFDLYGTLVDIHVYAYKFDTAGAGKSGFETEAGERPGGVQALRV